MVQKSELQRKILITAYDNPRMSQAEVARRADCSASYVSHVLGRYDNLDAMDARIEELNATLGIPARSMEHSTSRASPTKDTAIEPLALDEIPPIGFAVLAVAAGWIVGTADVFGGVDWYVRWGVVGLCAITTAIIIAMTWRTAKSNGTADGIRWLLDGSGSNSSSKSSSSMTKVPRPSEKVRNKLYFERANRRCEWCDEQTDHPEVHHITPRSEGGSNDLSNLVVLCANCHRRADSGSLPKNKLRYVVSD